VHDAATTCVRALLECGVLPPLSKLREAALQQLAGRWHNSRQRLAACWRRPRDAPVFLATLYGAGPTPEQRAEARVALFRYMVGWYNAHRRHSALGQRSPLAFERAYAAVQLPPSTLPVAA
jgi:transposase InsO family protein